MHRAGAALRPQRLQQHRSGPATQAIELQLAAQRVQIVGQAFLGLRGRPTRNADRFHAAGAGQAQAVHQLIAPAVIRTADLDDPALAGIRARQAHRAHHRLGSRTEQAHHLHRRHAGADQLGQFDLVFVQQSGHRSALVQHLVDACAQRRWVGAEQGRAAGLQEIDVAVVVDVGQVGALGAAHRQRERVVEGQVVLHAAGNHPLRGVAQLLGALAALLEVAHHLVHAIAPDRPHRLFDQRIEAAIQLVHIGPLRNRGSHAHCRCHHVWEREDAPDVCR